VLILLERHELPSMTVDGATWRRLLAMQERLIEQHDPSLADEPGRGLDHVIYAAICEGLRASEEDDGVAYNENTGERIS
jgi:hypothetical protein